MHQVNSTLFFLEITGGDLTSNNLSQSNFIPINAALRRPDGITFFIQKLLIVVPPAPKGAVSEVKKTEDDHKAVSADETKA